MERTNVHLSSRQIDDLDSLSDQTGLKRAELIRRAIDEFLTNQKDKRMEYGITGCFC